MISPWTIYQQKRESQLSRQKGKKGKDDPNKIHKKLKKKYEKQSPSQNDTSFQKQFAQDKDHHEIGSSQYQSSQKLQGQMQSDWGHNNIGGKQNKIQHIELNPKENNEKISQGQEDLFIGLDHPQLITDESISKQFLKNVVSDPLVAYLDNSKLLQFCKLQPNSDFLPTSPKNRRSVTNLMLIEAQRKSLIHGINSFVLLKCIKSSLRIEEALEKEAENNIGEILERLSYEFRPKISEQEIMLEKLLRNQQERMAKNLGGQKEKNIQVEKLAQKQKSKTSPSKNPKQNHSKIMETLQQDIQKSSIIKYINQTEPTYLLEQTPRKKSQKHEPNKSKQEIKRINLNINNQKLTEKLIYIGKKPFNGRVNNERDLKNESNEEVKDLSQRQNNSSRLDQNQNPQAQQLLQRQRKKNGKLMIENMIKQHMAIRQSRKQSKQSKNYQSIDKLQVQIRKLKSKNNKSSLSNLQFPEESNSISPRLKKSLTLVNPINGQPQKHHKKQSNLSLSSPLIPPEFELPRIINSSSSKNNLSSSSKLLQLITNNILLSKNNKSMRRNSSLNPPEKAGNILDQLFVKDKEKKLVMIRRNQGVNLKGKSSTKEILRQVNKKKLMSLDEQISELKEMEKQMGLGKKEQKLEANEVIKQSKNSTASQGKSRKELIPSDQHQAFNFMRKKPHQTKLGQLETQLLDLVSAETKNSEQNSKSLHQQMNSSTLKFSDHQIIHDMNNAIIPQKIKN